MTKHLTTQSDTLLRRPQFRSAVAVLLFALSGVSIVQADDYSEGMQAYMSDNYELAKILWLKGAKNNDGKSMFNLGFLHEQQLLQDSDLGKAEEWYRLAGANGYPAADYHLAQLLSAKQGNTQQARALVQRSASNGYSPAKKKISQADTADVSTPVVSVPTTVTASAAQAASGPGPYLGRNWINSQSAGNWTIQLLAFEDLSKVHQFIDQNGLRDMAAFFTENTDQGTLYKLVYGSFENKRLADEARQKMSGTLQANGPWLRSMRSVQKVISGR